MTPRLLGERKLLAEAGLSLIWENHAYRTNNISLQPNNPTLEISLSVLKGLEGEKPSIKTHFLLKPCRSAHTITALWDVGQEGDSGPGRDGRGPGGPP